MILPIIVIYLLLLSGAHLHTPDNRVTTDPTTPNASIHTATDHHAHQRGASHERTDA